MAGVERIRTLPLLLEKWEGSSNVTCRQEGRTWRIN